MRQKNRKINTIASIIGIIVGIFVLISALYLAYLRTQQEAEIYLSRHSITTNEKIRLFLNDIKLSLEEISKFKQQCNNRGKEALKRLVLNEPKISIAYIRQGSQTCATTEQFEFEDLIINENNSFILTGPKQMKDILQNAYILQLNYKDNVIGVVFPRRILDELLYESPHSFVQHTLYDEATQKIIFSTLPTHHLSLTKTDNSLLQINHLPFLRDVSVRSYLSYSWIWNKLKPHIIIFLMVALLICLLLGAALYRMTMHQLSLEYELRQALKNDQFVPHYQPVIKLKTGQFSGVECLMRWEINDVDVLQPDAFIPTAERSGLIKPMTAQLIHTIFEQLGTYANENKSFHMAINLSPQHFKDRETFELVEYYCKQYQINPEQIIFELTEQELIEEDDEYAVGIMRDMRAKGYSLAVDDFGTGYSSINYLRRFPFDFLKIDRQFIKAIGSTAVTAQLADSMIDLARNLNLKVIAEGLELSIHEAHLKKRDILYGQGWLYSKALSFEELQAFIRKQKV